MTKIKDLRPVERETADKHIELLEKIVEKNKTFYGQLKGVFEKQACDFGSMVGGGFLAGYVLSGGDADSAVYFAECATLFWAGWKISTDIPLRLGKIFLSKRIDEYCNRYEQATKREAKLADKLKEQGKFHEYKPKHGLSFSNHPFNLPSMIENKIQFYYELDLQTSNKPIRTTLRNVFGYATGIGIASLLIDIHVGILDGITGLNPFEWGIDAIHYASQEIQSLVGYTPQIVHQHVDNFNQVGMGCTGAAFGLLQSSKAYLKGSYYKLRTFFKRNKK